MSTFDAVKGYRQLIMEKPAKKVLIQMEVDGVFGSPRKLFAAIPDVLSLTPVKTQGDKTLVSLFIKRASTSPVTEVMGFICRYIDEVIKIKLAKDNDVKDDCNLHSALIPLKQYFIPLLSRMDNALLFSHICRIISLSDRFSASGHHDELLSLNSTKAIRSLLMVPGKHDVDANILRFEMSRSLILNKVGFFWVLKEIMDDQDLEFGDFLMEGFNFDNHMKQDIGIRLPEIEHYLFSLERQGSMDPSTRHMPDADEGMLSGFMI